MFRFRLEIAGEVQMDRGIARFADGLSDYRPIWPVIEDDFYAQVKDQFKTEGEEGGEKWAPLSPEYAGYKEAHFPGKPILERTGELTASLTNPNDPNTVRIEERKSLTLGSRVPYAIYHQTGTKKMPARPEIKLTEAFKRTAMHHVQTYLVQMANSLGFRQGMKPLDVGWQQAWARRKGMGGFDGWPG
jgi:phage gpG-like protein